MTRDEFRLELIKVCHRHDLHPDDVVTRAKILEDYVTDSPGEKPPVSVEKRGPGRPRKEIGNLDPLS
jgi:hypothetical protein